MLASTFPVDASRTIPANDHMPFWSPVSRGFELQVHGVIKPGQLEPPFPAVIQRMPIDVWEFEDLLNAAHGKTICVVPAEGVFVLQCCRITKCADRMSTQCLTGEPCLMWLKSPCNQQDEPER
jgi:hypothetical protein